MNYPSNSHKAKDEPKIDKKIEKVVQGEVTRRKKPLGKRFSETFVQGEAKGVWSYVLFDVCVPAAKDMVSDAVSTGVERMLFGESRGTARRGGGRGANGFVNYGKFAEKRPDPRAQISRKARSTHDFDEIILPSRAEAGAVIDQMFEIVSKYEVVTVADLYDLCDITSSYTDEKWGWTDIRGATVTRVRNGYLLDLPRPEPID